jgi:UDP-2,4-diacetamido-2,4,6-trideoxy-beta-L-altropyranose hydrolase
MIQKNLIIRADAGSEIGTGHVMRCLALGQAWQDRGGTVTFITASDSHGLAERVRAEGMDWAVISAKPGSDNDARLTGRHAKKTGAGWVVVDGYHFSDHYLAIIRCAGLKILAIDDKGYKTLFHADIILNQNVYASCEIYQNQEPAPTLLLGTKYALIRREFFRKGRVERQEPDIAKKILVTLGGSDPDNATQKVIEAIRDITVTEGLKAVIVTGYNNPHFNALVEAAGGSPGIQLIRPTADMPGLMAWADMAVIAAGSTAWEMAFIGMPFITLVIADNQLPVAEGLEKLGATVNMGWSLAVTPGSLGSMIRTVMQSRGLRQALSGRVRELVDGEGAARVIMHLCNEKIRVRPVRWEDREQLWEWANETTVRRMSFHQEPIPWEEHIAWFEKKFQDPACFLYIAVTEDDVPVGQIRFDVQDNKAIVDVSVDREWRDKGLGPEIIRGGIQRLLAEKPGIPVHTQVKLENVGSVRAFEKAGFVTCGTGQIRDSPVVFLSWKTRDR